MGGRFRDGGLHAGGLLGVLLGLALVGIEGGKIGRKGKLNRDALKQRPLLNLQGFWGWDDPSNLIRTGERKPGIHSHPPSSNSHCLQAVLEEGNGFESGSSLQGNSVSVLEGKI